MANSTFGTNAVFIFILILLFAIIFGLAIGFIGPAANARSSVLEIASKATLLQNRFNAFATQVENTSQRAAELTTRSSNIEGKLPILACGFVKALLDLDAAGKIVPPFTIDEVLTLTAILATDVCQAALPILN